MGLSLKTSAVLLSLAFAVPAAWVGAAQPLPLVPGAPAAATNPGCLQGLPPEACTLADVAKACRTALSKATCEGGGHCEAGARKVAGCTDFLFTESAPLSGSAVAVAVSPAGDRVATTGGGVGTVVVDATTGEKIWSKSFFGAGIVFSKGGTQVFVTGTESSDAVTVAFDALTGAQLWRRSWDGGSGDEGRAVALSPDGSILFVLVMSYSYAGRHYSVVAYHPTTGSELWASRYAVSNDANRPTGFAVNPDGTAVYVVGNAGRPNWEGVIIAFGASNGAVLWSDRVSAAGMAYNPSSVVVSPDGTTVYTLSSAYSFASGTADAVVRAYAAVNGAPLWSVTQGDPRVNDVTTGAVVSPDGGTLYVTVWDWPFHLSVLALDASTGSQRWISRTVADPGTSLGTFFPLVSPDGLSVFVIGTYNDWGARDSDVFMLHLLADSGDRVWTTYHGVGSKYSDYATAVAQSPSGAKIFVAGSTREVSRGHTDSLLLSLSTGRLDVPAL